MDKKQSEPFIQDNLSPDGEIKSGYATLARENSDGVYELGVLVQGVYCAACIYKIEKTLSSQKDVESARLNFSTNRLNFSWRGSANLANDYVQLVESLGYGIRPYDMDTAQKESDAQEKFLLLCLGVAGFAMGNIMLLSFGLWMTDSQSMGYAVREFMHWIQATIGLPTIAFAGRPFFYSAIKALKNGHTNMDVPISLGLILTGGMSLYETITHGEHVYFESAVMLIFFLLIGRYLDFRARRQARSSAEDLLSTFQGFATVVDGTVTKKILIRDLREGMLVRVAAADKFPVDGVVVEGGGEVDTSLVTGETLPRHVVVGDEVYAGTMNVSSPVLIRVLKQAEDSLLADIVRLIEKAQQGQAAYVRLADKVARLYTPVVHSFAALAFLGWFFMGGLSWQESLIIAITVLIVTCPCALALAVPVVQVLATGRLMKKNILVKSGDALERLAGIDTVFFDKTGTLTRGYPELQSGYQAQALPLAASLASYSNHLLSKAFGRAYRGNILPLEDVQEISGKGLQALYRGKKIYLGSKEWCGDKTSVASDLNEVWLRVEGEQPCVFYFNDQLRADAKDTINHFKKAGLNLVMLSGDRGIVAQKIAQECGLEEVHADKSPVEKFNIIEQYKARGHKVLMVGDGLNDAPSLQGADVSMAPGTAIDMAQNAADVVFMGDELAPAFEAYQTACFTQKLVRHNFILAILYNLIAIPLAFCGMVTPLVAAIAMSGSSLIVIANSFRLRLKS